MTKIVGDYGSKGVQSRGRKRFLDARKVTACQISNRSMNTALDITRVAFMGSVFKLSWGFGGKRADNRLRYDE